MKRDWCIDTADAGLSAEDSERFWRDGETPQQFVARFAEKYDLIRFEAALDQNAARQFSASSLTDASSGGGKTKRRGLMGRV